VRDTARPRGKNALSLAVTGPLKSKPACGCQFESVPYLTGKFNVRKTIHGDIRVISALFSELYIVDCEYHRNIFYFESFKTGISESKVRTSYIFVSANSNRNLYKKDFFL
jgi:hypothetical protein